jgi:predicted transcriptional regulator
MSRIQETAQGLIDEHGTVRAAAEACGISYSLLWKLAKGKQRNPTVDTLAKLGLTMRRTYARKPNGAP